MQNLPLPFSHLTRAEQAASDNNNAEKARD
jgi:hypothetical protein